MLSVVGPGAIALGAALGSGEWLIGPATFVKYGLTLLWVTLLAAAFQTLFNTEVVRYTLYTGEPAFTGFMRTRPSARFWAWVYSIIFFCQSGWPGWAGASAGALFYLGQGRLPGPDDARTRLPPGGGGVRGLRPHPRLRRQAHRADARDPELGPRVDDLPHHR